MKRWGVYFLKQQKKVEKIEHQKFVGYWVAFKLSW